MCQCVVVFGAVSGYGSGTSYHMRSVCEYPHVVLESFLRPGRLVYKVPRASSCENDLMGLAVQSCFVSEAVVEQIQSDISTTWIVTPIQCLDSIDRLRNARLRGLRMGP